MTSKNSVNTNNKQQSRFWMKAGTVALVVAVGGSLAACGSNSGQAESTSTASESSTVEALSTETHIVWENNLGTDLTFAISDTQNNYWDGDSRPDHSYPNGISGYTLASGNTFNERLEVNMNRSLLPTFTVAISNSSGEILNQKMVYSSVTTADGLRVWNWGGDKPKATLTFTYKDSSGKSKAGEVTPSFSGTTTTLSLKTSS